jgi:hypothetical protein
MEDDLNVCEREDLNKNNATETMKSKSNGCGTAPGNLVMNYKMAKNIQFHVSFKQIFVSLTSFR